MSFVDEVIGVFSPRAKLKRLQYKRASEMLTEHARKYEGASKTQRTSKWHTSGTSANSEIKPYTRELRNRARDLVRNVSHATRAVQLISNNVVGHGIIPYFKAPTEAIKDQVNKAWEEWSGSTNCDVMGVLDFYSMQNLVMRSVVESGEVFVRKLDVAQSKNAYGMQLQLLESDFCPLDRADIEIAGRTSRRMKMGIELGQFDRPTAYHFYEAHPGNLIEDFNSLSSQFKTFSVPSENVAHVYRIDRPGQLRGVTWLHAVIITLLDLSRFQDAQLVKQQVSACFAAFIHDIEAPDDGASGEQVLERLEPGVIEYLPTGKDIKFATPPLPQADSYRFYVQSILHSVASAIGVSYEALSGDLTDVNFSSARMGWLEFQRNIDCWRYNILKPRFLDPTVRWFLQKMETKGLDISQIRWGYTFPKREMIDPTKEVAAKIKSIRSGIDTLSSAIRETGRNPEEQLEELSAERLRLKQLGLVLDSDPSVTSQTGFFQVSDQNSNGENIENA